MANRRWCGAGARKLLRVLAEREERRARWAGTRPSDIMVDMNAAITRAAMTPQPYPDSVLLSYDAYMLLTGHTLVKLGRRKRVWRRI